MNTQEFFSELYKGVPSEKVTYCYTLPGRKCKPFAVGEMEQLAHREMELSATENVYFGLHTMDHAPRPGGRASAEEITGVAFLHGEYDVWGQGHQETRLPETQEEVLNFLHALEQPPSIIVSSGNGVHTYWLLEDYRSPTTSGCANICGSLMLRTGTPLISPMSQLVSCVLPVIISMMLPRMSLKDSLIAPISPL